MICNRILCKIIQSDKYMQKGLILKMYHLTTMVMRITWNATTCFLASNKIATHSMFV